MKVKFKVRLHPIKNSDSVEVEIFLRVSPRFYRLLDYFPASKPVADAIKEKLES
jgi:hypothetical protein